MESTEFSTTLVQSPAGVHITLVRLSDGNQKKFFLAGDKKLSRIQSHMDSLTDELRHSFYDDSKKHSGKKKGK